MDFPPSHAAAGDISPARGKHVEDPAPLSSGEKSDVLAPMHGLIVETILALDVALSAVRERNEGNTRRTQAKKKMANLELEMYCTRRQLAEQERRLSG